MSKELTLSELLTQRCVEFANSEQAVEIIDKGIANLFNNVVDDAFRSYGDFGKAFKKAMESALPTSIEDMVDLKKYNTLVTEKMRNSWEKSGIETDLQEKVAALVKDFVSEEECPKYIKASDLWEAFIEGNASNAIENGWDSPQVFFDDERDGSIFVSLHPDEATSSYNSIRESECDYRFFLSSVREDGYGSELFLHEGHQVYELFGGKVKGNTLGKRIINPYSRFDKLILNLYYGGSLLVWDESPEDICYCNDY
ncbi:hypothetical protein CO695_17805 [Providencia alcalifaciens]|uniref:Uncharacterized protein n=1 Tax=Providencia alcalifaciens DSM 30120 TaxID=520999 RepID=B6XBN8_9GAMM|nr:hypothetical protein [Providencia alcalifaciens]ATG18066.1 hypothetical protein CO695_17805 [Providencia alcalifaciens]EEB47040.1 hypothetical protein PROVALCAL_00749 [Providencia alcalifaciens DSM 30120]